MSRYLGIDLHTNCFTVCAIEQSGESKFEEYKLDAVAEFTRRLRASDHVAVEATGNTRFFRDSVASHVANFVVVDPGQFEIIKKSVAKTDKRDAKSLALFLSKGLLPEARMKEKAQAQMSSLVQTRDKLVKLRTALINKIHAVMNAHGKASRKEQYSSEAGLERVLASDGFDEIVVVELEVLVTQIRSLNAGIKKLDAEIKERGAKLEGHKNLTSIKGIGDKSAAILLSVIGNISDFAGEAQLASYFGIVPRVRQSNQREYTGAITKRGSKIGRTCLVQCTLVAKRYSPYLKNYYERIKAKRGSGKAIIATARKFLGIIYQTLKHKWVFEDFPNFVLAEQ